MLADRFIHRRGTHCGSTALADVLRFHGLDLPEHDVFALGAGCGFSLHDGDVTLEPAQAGRFFVGRSASFEQDLCDAVGAQLHSEVFASGAQAWARAQEHVRDGTPVLAYTNLKALPYLNARGHWFGHLVVIVGDDGTHALVADNEHDELQRVAHESLQAALGLGAPVRTGADVELLTVGAPRKQPDRAQAFELQRLRMTDDATETTGVRGVQRLADEIRTWKERADWKRCVRLASQVIETRGCGGGLFRRMYARFHPLALEAATAWSALAQELELARTFDEPRLAEAAARAESVAQAEDKLWH